MVKSWEASLVWKKNRNKRKVRIEVWYQKPTWDWFIIKIFVSFCFQTTLNSHFCLLKAGLSAGVNRCQRDWALFELSLTQFRAGQKWGKNRSLISFSLTVGGQNWSTKVVIWTLAVMILRASWIMGKFHFTTWVSVKHICVSVTETLGWAQFQNHDLM